MKKVLLIVIPSIIFIIGIVLLFIFVIMDDIKVSLNGDNPVNLSVGQEYIDLGFSITNHNKELKKDTYIFETQNNIDKNTLGNYTYTYKIKFKNKEYYLERTINVIDDIKPEITTFLETITRDFCTKNNTEEFKYSIIDNYDGDITENAITEEIDDKFIISGEDSSKNKSTIEIPITYTKEPSPTFSLNGNSKVYVLLNGTYNESGAVYKDGCGNVIEKNISTSGSVDTSKTGEYIVTYSTEDMDDIKRTVVVYENKIKYGNNKTIYLTFDDGPGVYTKKILDTLAKYNVKATFFVTAQFGGYLYLIKNEHDSGHSVGVHTLTHQWDVYSSVDAYINDFNKMNDIVEQYTGSRSRIFRFPGGSSNTISRRYQTGVVSQIASRMTSDGYVYFDWDVDSTDAAGASSTQVYNRVVNGVQSCSKCIVLMHDIKSSTANALDNILSTLTQNGYTFGTLSTSSPTVHHTIVN